MKYGHFDDAKREYVITRPDTPSPWLNYLGCEDYFGLITNTAGGYSFYKDARLRRLTRYRYNNAPADTGGRYLYLRDNANGEYWSPSWQPTQRELQDYSCRHGMGYTIIGSTYQGVHAETRYFVPLGENLEIWQLTIENTRDQAVDLSIFSAIEFCLWDAWEDATNFQRNLSIGEVEVEGSVIYHKTEYRERRDHFAFFACSEKVEGFDTQREKFLGAYRGWDKPQVVEMGESTNSIAHGWQPMGSHQLHITLKPGEDKTINFVLGYSENPNGTKFDPSNTQVINKKIVNPIIAKYLAKANADKAFEELRAYWEKLLGILHVKTPNEHMNRMLNIWNAYQCMVTFNLSRSASLFESGVGRGLGFRDSNQDLLGFVHMVPAKARQRLLDIAATQLPDGGAYHQYQPLTKRGNDAIGSNFNDDPLWLVISVAAYLRETGDWSILDELVQYDNEPGSETAFYVHLERSIQYTLDRIGPHGLPLIGRADWNDCLNLNSFSESPGQSFQTTVTKNGKVAESVFIAGLFVAAAREMEEISKRYGGKDKRTPQSLNGYSEAADEMTDKVYSHGWDGEWFLRAYDDFGNKVGSKESEEGKIFLETQGIIPMAGIGLENGQARQALDSVNKYLATEHGLVLLQPAFTKYYLHLGEISSYPPGYKENAGVFCHANPWAIIAETKLGNAERAMDYYMRINPSVREPIADLHRCEPYVYAQMIAGKDAPTHGEAKNSWLTGTAAWNYVAATQHILGIRAGYEGLTLQPCLPSDWIGYSATRVFRGATYQITVERSGSGASVVLSVDGEIIPGDLVPLAKPGTTVRVKATIG
jgi:cellobiose phosphorylase